MHLQVRNVSKIYDSHKVVNQVSFEVSAGETLVLLGTSGCGKTTTLKMINRLVEPSSGEIFLGNENILLDSPESLRRRIGYVIQSIGLFPHYTVAQNISVVPRLLHWREDEIKMRVRQLLEMVQMNPDETVGKLPAELSGGQKQRVGFARALAARPPVILMDEPFGALDPITRASIQEEFAHLPELQDKTKILVTHDMNEAIELGDRICLMHQGVIEAIGTPKELLFEPRSKFVTEFFQAQRLHLELMVLTLQDIVELLPEEKSTDEELPLFSSNSRLLKVLEVMEQREDGQQKLRVASASQSFLTSCEGLMSAFYRYKLTKNQPLDTEIAPEEGNQVEISIPDQEPLPSSEKLSLPEDSQEQEETTDD